MELKLTLKIRIFLTETYRKRHQYSATSSVNFEKLIDRELTVSLNGSETQDKTKHLYDIVVQKNQDKMMIYPYSQLGSNYYVDIVQTSRANIVLRYSISLKTIEVSFDGKFFTQVPILEDIIGNPQLTRDGLGLVAFTKKGLAKCKLVAQETVDFVLDTVLIWTVEPYMRKLVYNGFPGYLGEADSNFVPVGYFETIDQYAYIFVGPSIHPGLSGNIQYLYAEWLYGTNDVVYDYQILTTDTGNLFTSDDLRLKFKYVAPTTTQQDISCVASIISPDGTFTCIFFKINTCC